MAMYKMMCDDGHEPEEMMVEAEDDDLAMQMMMAKAKSHNSEKHPGMNMSDEEIEGYIRSHWSK